MNEAQAKIEKPNSEKLVENVDYYYENGLMVLTAHFLKKRGYCCANGCRHCPYQNKSQNENAAVS